MGLRNVSASAKHHLGFALARLGRFDEARAVQWEAIQAFRAQGDRRMEGCGYICLAEIRKAAGDVQAAETDAWRAVELLTDIAPLLPYALAMLAAVLLAAGRPGEAAEHAKEAVEILDSVGSVEEGESFIRLVCAEALAARGDSDAARTAMIAASERLTARALKIADPEWRNSFLERVPEHARTLHLAAEWGVRESYSQ
jgi:tetratricopeptide (TPR) repeat protein